MRIEIINLYKRIFMKDLVLKESIMEFSEDINKIFKRYKHLYIFWDNRDFKYATENYTYWHRAVAWDSKVYTPWEVVPMTFDNNLPLEIFVLHHGIHPADWIVENVPNTKSLPPERLRKDILLELEAHLLSEALCKVKVDVETYSEIIVEEPIENRFEILDL